ncbi:MAG: PKD domain-containing protein [Bacteroidales bacterium]|nr:PKD domain-containing protein [Bacteroidales bacterium]
MVLISLSFGVIAQSRLVSNDPPNNIYSLTFTDVNQQQIVAHFDDFVTSEGTNAGWSITVGGAPVALIGAPTRSGTTVTITIATPISFNDRNNVFVSYSAAAGSISLLTGLEPDFAGVQAYNNYIAIAGDFTNGLYGENPPKDICAAVENVEVEMNLILSKRYRNSIHYATPRAYISWEYPSDNPKTQPFFTETSVGSGVYNVVSNYAAYPDNTINCTWEISMFPYLHNTGTLQPTLLVTQNRVLITIPNYKKDNGTPAPGTGTLGIDPPLDDLSTLFCVGEDIVDFVFDEVVVFDCRYEVETVLPNINTRWIQFVYGTHGGGLNGIPNVFIQVGATPVQVTDANGDGIIQQWFVNPDGSPNPGGYFTSSGYFEGPVEDYDFNTTEPYDLIDARIQTYPISHTGNFDTDEVDDVFEVTLNVWGPCNPLGDAPVTDISRLRLVEAPPPPTVPTLMECFGSVTPTLTATGTGGVIEWYDDPRHRNPPDLVHTGASFTHGETAPGVYNWWVTESRDYGSGVTCPSDTSRSTLTITPIPNKPDISVAGPTDFCFDGGVTSVTLTANPNEPPTIISYQWYRNGISVGGATSNTIVLDAIAETGNYIVRTYGVAPTNCPSPFTDPQVINIYALATTTDPPNRMICADDNMTTGNTTFGVTVGGAAHAIQWQRSDGGPWVNITAAAAPNDGCTYGGFTTATLSITEADYAINGYLYRVKLTTTAGACEIFSGSGLLTVNPIPNITTQPVDQTECEFNNAAFNVAANIVAGSIDTYQWQRENSDINAGTDGGAYTGFTTSTLTVNNPDRTFDNNRYRVIITSDQGCPLRSNNQRLYINPLADITTQPVAAEICENDNTSFSLATDGNPAVTGYQWQVQTGGVGPWNNAAGIVYNGGATATLNLTGVPIGYSTNLYKCVLTTNGPCPIESNTALLTVNPNPTASINPAAPAELCTGDVINFDGQPAGGTGGYSHSWTGDTGPLSVTNTQTPNFTAPVLGSQTTYNLTYTVTDGKTCTGTDNVAVVVNPTVTVNVMASLAEVCSNGTVNLDGDPQGGTGAITSLWTGTGAGFLSGTGIATPTFTAPVVVVQTTYTLTYRATDTKGCYAEQSINIDVNPNPSASILPGAPGELCYNEVQTLDGNPSGGTGGYIHAWTGDVTPLDVTNTVDPDFTAPSTGVQTTYNLTYTVQDGKSCMGTDVVTLTVNPEVVSAVLTGDASICSGNNADLQVAITGGTGNFTVTLSDLVPPLITTENNYVSGANITTGPHTAATNTYTISSVVDSKGCRATSETGSATILVGSIPTAAVLTGGTAICLGQTTPLQVNITGGAPPYKVVFDVLPDETNYISGADIATGILGLGTWDFNIVSVTDNCGVLISGAAVAGGNPQQITINPIPVITATNNDAVICSDGTTNIGLATSVGNTVYNWTVNDGGGVTWVGGRAPANGSITDGVGVQTILQNLQHTMNTTVSVVYTITSAGPLPTTCAGNTEIETVIVEPTPEAAITNSTQTICDGAALTGMAVSSVVTHNGAPTFDMAIVATTGNLGDLTATGVALTTLLGQAYPYTITGTLTNNTNDAIVIEYRVTPKLAGCSDGAVEVATVTIEPTPIAAISNSTQTICDGAGFTDMIVSNVATHSGTPEFDMTITATTGNLGDLTVTGNALTPRTGRAYPYTISGTLTNNTDDAIVIEYRVTPLLPTCSNGADVLATITIEPTPVATISNNAQVLCDGGALTGMTVNTAANPTGVETFDLTIVATTGLLADLTATGLALTTVSGQAYPYTISGTLTNNTDDAIVVEYRVVPKLAGCGDGALVTATVTVEPTPVAAISNAAQTICDGASIADMIVSNEATHNGTPEFNLVITATTGNLGDLTATGNVLTAVAGQAYPYTISGSLTNNTDDAITIEYQVTPVLPGCTNGTDVFATITIEPTPVAAISNAAQTLCDGDALTGMVVTSAANPAGAESFNLAIVATTGNVGDLTGTGNSLTTVLGNAYPYTISGTLTNNTDDAITIEYRITPLLAGCSNGAVETAVVTIEPTPVAAISNAVQTLCDGDALVGMVVSNEATHSGTPVFDLSIVATTGNLGDLTATGNSLTTRVGENYPYTISGTLTNNTDDAIVIEYRVIPTLPGCTDGAEVVAEVTIEPTPIATISNNAQVLCDGDALTGMIIATAANPSGVETFNLDIIATVGNLGDLTATGGALTTVAGGAYPYAINGTLTNDTDDAITVQYRVTPLLAGCSNGTVVTATVTIEPTPVAAISNAVQTLCDGDALVGMAVTNEATHNGTPEFDLVIVATTGLLGDLTATGLALTTVSGQAYPYTISGTLTNNTDDAIVIEYRVTPLLPTCGNGALVTAVVTIEPTPKAAISNAAQTLCDGDALTGMAVTSAANPTGAESFNLAIVATTGNLADLTATGLALTTVLGQAYPYTISGTLTNNTDDAITIEYRVTPLLAGCGNGAMETAVITIEPTPIAAISNNAQTICDGATLTGMVVTDQATHSGAPAFDLAIVATTGNIGNLTATGVALTTQSDQAYPYTISGTLTNNTNAAITIEYRVTPKLTGCGNGVLVTAVVTIEPTPVAAISNNVQTICDGDAVTGMVVSNLATHSGAATFDLDIVATTGNLGDLSATGVALTTVTGEAYPYTINGTITNNTFATIVIEYRVTPLLAGCSDGVVVVSEVTIYPTPTANPAPLTQTIPNGSATDITMGGDVAGTTFGWRVLNPGTTNATDGGPLNIGEKITQTLANNGAVPITVTYRIGPSANGCTGDSTDVVITIDPSVDMTVVNNAPHICTTGSSDLDLSSSVAGATFAWTVTDPGGAGASAGNGGPNTHTIQQQLFNVTTAPITVTYHITPTGPGPTFIIGTTQDIDVTVYPKPVGIYTNREPQICNGSAANIELDSDVAGSTFTWTVTDPSGASGATPSGAALAIGDSIFQVLANLGTTAFTVTYHIRPTGQGAVTCPGDILDVDVIVDPTPVASVTNTTPVICSGETTDITLNASVVGSTFTYAVADPKGTGATGGVGVIGSVISQLLVNATQTPVTIQYEIIPSGPGATACPGAAVYENVTVNPLPITSAITGIDTVCEGTANLVFSVVHTADSYYEWNVPAILGNITFGGSGLDSYAAIVLAANTAVQVTDSIWVFETNQYGCTKDTIYKPMTIIPFPVQVNITGDAAVCALTTHTYSVPNNVGSTYQWFIPPGAGFASADPTINTVDVTFGLISGQVRVIETSSGGCVTIHNPLNITVNQLPITTLNADKIAACDGDTITFTAGPAAQLNYEFFVNGGSEQNGVSNIFKTAGLVNNDQVTVNVTSVDGCENLSMPLAITIYDPPVVILSSSDADNIICAGENVSFMGTSGSAVNYNFFLNGVSQQSGALNFWSTIGLVDGDEVHVEALSAFGCWGGSDTITTTVNALPVAVISGDNTICPGNSTDLAVNITVGAPNYDVTIDNGVGLLSNYVSGTAIPVSPAFTTIYTLVSVVDANGCLSAILTPSAPNLTGSAVVTVRDTVEILTQPRQAETCEGIDTSFSVGAIGDGLTFQWETTDDLANPFGNIGGATAATYFVVGPTAAIDGHYYRVRVSSSFCPEFAYSDTVQLTLKYDPALVAHPADQTICEADGTGFAVNAGLTSNPIYQWQVSYDGGGAWLDLGDTAVYNGTSTDSVAVISAASRFNGYQYKVVVTGECGTPIESNVATLTIDERPEILQHPSDITVCEGLPVSFSVNAGVTSGVVYQWEVDMGSGFVVLGDTALVYSGTAADVLNVLNPESRFNGYEYRAVVSGVCPVPQTSNPALLIVNEIPEIVTQPLDATICENESPLFIVNAGVTSGASYQWQVSYNGGGAWSDLGDTAIYTGTASNTLRLTGVPSTNDGNLYHVVVSGLCVPAVTSADVTLTVRERPEIIQQPSDTIVCEGVPARFDVDAGVTANAAYQWQVNMNDGNGFNDFGDTLGIYTGSSQAVLQILVPASRFNGYQYRVIVSGDCIPPQVSNTATLTVNELPEITVEPVDKTICEEQNTFFTVSSGVTTNPLYQWQVDMGSGFVDIGSDTGVYSGTGSPNLFMTLVPSDYNGYVYHVVVSGACAPAMTSADVLLTVNENPEIILQPENDTICEGDVATFTVDAGVTTSVTYQWQVNRVGLWEDLNDGLDYTGTDTGILTVNNPVTTYHGYRYRVIVSGVCNPPVTSAEALLVVDERPEIITQPVDQAFCEDGDLYFHIHPGNTTTPVILWEYSTDGVAWNPADGLPEITDASNDTLFLSAIPSAYDGYMFHAVISGKCPAVVTSDPAVMTVYEKPQIDTQPVDVDACEQDTVMFFVDAGVTTNPAYQWEIWNGAAWIVPPPDIYSGVNTDTMYINGIHSGIDGLQIRLRLSGSCVPGLISDTAMLTVYERPEVVGQPLDVTICEGDSALFGVDAGVTTNPTYTWEYFDGGSWQTASGGFFADETTDTLKLEGVPATWTGTEFRAIISNLCGPNDTSTVVDLVVNERPGIVTQPVDVTTCEGIAAAFSMNAGVTTNPGYLWQYHGGVTWLPVTGVQYSGQGTNTLNILNPVSAMNGYAFRVIVTGYCDPFVISDSVIFTVEENAEVIQQPVYASICENGDTIFTVNAGVTTNPTFQWYYNDGVSGWLAVTADGVHAGFLTNTLVLNSVPWSMDNWLYRAEVSGDCGSTVISDPAGLVVYKLPEIVAQPVDTTTCELLNVSFTVDVGDTDAPFLQWEENDGVSGWQLLSDGGNYIGTNSTELKVYAVDSAMTGFRYRVSVRGECDPEVISGEVTLTVQSAPDIWTQPVDETICEGDNTSFSIFATGTGITYQWQVDAGSGFTDITGSNGGVYAGWDSNTLVLTGADRTFNFNRYRIRVEGTCVPMTLSNLAILFVQTPPEIQTEPVDNTICEFENAVYSVNATGEGLSYQWQESTNGGGNWNVLSDVGFYIGSATPTLSVFNVERGYDGYMYRVIITGACGVPAQSVDVNLTVRTAPEILTQPVALTACENLPAGFGLEAQGTNIIYQWQVNEGTGFNNILLTDPLYTGADTDSLTLLSAQPAQAGYSFRAIVTGDCPPAAISNPVIMLVNANPVITSDPVDDAICEDGSTVFSAGATGPELVYQWYVDRNDGNGFVVLTDDAVHLGSNTDQINLTSVPVTMDGWQYRLDVFSVCMPISTAVVTLTVWPNPTSSILGDLPNYPLICGGDLLTLDGNPSGGSGTWSLHQWTGDIGPLSAINEQVVEFETLIKGQYNLAYRVTDDRGCVGTDVVTIENDRPTAQFSSDAVPSCGYIEVNFINNSTADAVTFLWDFGDGTTSTQEDVSHGFDNVDPGGLVAYYHVKLIASSVNSCRDTAQSVITIYPKVVATIDADTTEGCHPLAVTFLTQPGGASYYWDFGDGNAEDGGYLAHHLYENYTTAAVTRTVELTTTSFYGCQDSETLDITIQPIPAPNFTAVPLVQTYPDATVAFTNETTPGPWTYLWDFGDSLSSTEENPTHTYADPGTYLVKFYVNNGSCIDSIRTSIVIHPRIPEADFDVPEGGCTPMEIQFVNQSLWATTYLWDFGDGYVSTKEHPTHTFYDPGEVTVRLQATGPGGTDYASHTINVYETPNIAFNSAPDSVFVKDKPVRFFNLSAGADQYLWDFGDYFEDGTPAEGNFTDEEDPQHIYFTEGWKDVKLVGWNDHCIDSLTMTVVKVISAGDIQFPTVFRPDPDGPSGGWIDPNDPNLDPNIKNSIFFPGVNRQVDEYHLYIYSRWGDLIFQSHDINHGWDGYIKGSLASQGVYIWKVTLVYKNGSPDSMAGDITLIWKRPQ